NDGTTPGNNGNLKPMASYPSDAAGVAAADGSAAATSWSAYGSAGQTSAADEVTAFALCSTDATAPAVRVARIDKAGPDAQAGTTPIANPVSCPASTRLIGGGYKVDESVGVVDGLQPQQGYHMRGSYPTADALGATEAADGATNLTTWTSLVQAGGQSLAAGKHMNLRGFALCAEAPAPVADLALTIDAVPSPAVVGQPITYTLKVAASGAAATGVKLTDTLPAGAAFVSADPPACTFAAGAVTCALGGLAAGGSTQVKVVATPATVGDAVNEATVASDTMDPTAADNFASSTVEVLAAPRVKPSLNATAAGAGRVNQVIGARATIASSAVLTGSVTFRLYGPDDATCANAVASSTATVAGGGDYASAQFLPVAAGVYRWTASYGGDGANEPVATRCDDAAIVVKAVPEILLAATSTGATATLSEGSALGGSLTFTVFADAACASPLASSSVNVAGNGSYAAAPFAAPGPGVYHWVVSYGGDARNVAVGPTDCGGATFSLSAGSPPPPPVVVSPPPVSAASNRFTVRSSKASRTGVLTMKLDAPGAGKFVASARANGAAFGSAKLSTRAKGGLTLTLKPSAKAKRALLRHKRVKVSVTVTFTPTGGTPLTRKLTVTIKRS
ncbi:MAG TPA: DUF11 domain-containing protein, partial [Solirubrobacter sp.]